MTLSDSMLQVTGQVIVSPQFTKVASIYHTAPSGP